MKIQKSLFAAIISAGLLALAAAPAAAQSVTNLVTFTLSVQYAGDTTDNGTTTSTPLTTMKIANKDLLSLLAKDEFAAGNYSATNFPTGAKLAIVDGDIQVLSKTNTLILDVSDVFWMDSSYDFVETGKFSDDTSLPSPSSAELGRIRFVFDDTGIIGGNDLSFEMVGLAKSTYTDTVPNVDTGVYTESQTHMISALAGDGYSNGSFFVISGSASASGKGTLIY